MIRCYRCGWWRDAERHMPCATTRERIKAVISKGGCCVIADTEYLGALALPSGALSAMRIGLQRALAVPQAPQKAPIKGR